MYELDPKSDSSHDPPKNMSWPAQLRQVWNEKRIKIITALLAIVFGAFGITSHEDIGSFLRDFIFRDSDKMAEIKIIEPSKHRIGYFASDASTLVAVSSFDYGVEASTNDYDKRERSTLNEDSSKYIHYCVYGTGTQDNNEGTPYIILGHNILEKYRLGKEPQNINVNALSLYDKEVKAVAPYVNQWQLLDTDIDYHQFEGDGKKYLYYIIVLAHIRTGNRFNDSRTISINTMIYGISVSEWKNIPTVRFKYLYPGLITNMFIDDIDNDAVEEIVFVAVSDSTCSYSPSTDRKVSGNTHNIRTKEDGNSKYASSAGTDTLRIVYFSPAISSFMTLGAPHSGSWRQEEAAHIYGWTPVDRERQIQQFTRIGDNAVLAIEEIQRWNMITHKPVSSFASRRHLR
jgi:hypothetical protein